MNSVWSNSSLVESIEFERIVSRLIDTDDYRESYIWTDIDLKNIGVMHLLHIDNIFLQYLKDEKGEV